MINGIMTLSGAWHKLRDDPVLRFMIVSLSFYGMSTFEGPMMSIKTVNALSHYTDWTIGHVHSGAMGWVGLVSTKVVKSDDIAHGLIDQASHYKADLIVMASHGRKGIKRLLLGSETLAVLTHVKIPVLVLR